MALRTSFARCPSLETRSAQLRSHSAGRVSLAALLLLAWAQLFFLGCARSNAEERLLVFASASLGEAVDALAEDFQRRHGGTVGVHTAGTPRLVLQLTEGAPADVFVAADLDSIHRVRAARPEVTAPRPLAKNRMVVVTNEGNPLDLRTPADLQRAGLRVALCAPHVPAGRYARSLLKRAGISVQSVSDEPNVRAVVSKVMLGEVDAGIVYHTDTLAAGERLHALPLSSEHAVRTPCSFAGVRPSTRADAFLAYLASPEGRTILEDYGFEAP